MPLAEEPFALDPKRSQNLGLDDVRVKLALAPGNAKTCGGKGVLAIDTPNNRRYPQKRPKTAVGGGTHGTNGVAIHALGVPKVGVA